MPANYKPFDKEEWLRLEKKADELRRLTYICQCLAVNKCSVIKKTDYPNSYLGRFGPFGRCAQRYGCNDYFVSPFYEA